MRRTRLRGWVATWPDILLATLVACLAWFFAESILGHRQPTFAATAAIVCLAPGVTSRGRQALGLLFGVAAGTVVGIAEYHFVGTRDSLWVAALAAPAMIVSAVTGASAITVIQAGATAILLATGGRATAGAHLEDAAIGAGLSLLVSQVLLSPNPVRLVEARSRQMFVALQNAFENAARALESGGGEGSKALDGFDEAMRHATDVTAALESARGLERWTVRGRWSKARIDRLVTRYDREATRLCASALLFGEALVATLPDRPPTQDLGQRVRACAQACAALADGKTPATPTNAPVDVPPRWVRAENALEATIEALDEMIKSAPPT